MARNRTLLIVIALVVLAVLALTVAGVVALVSNFQMVLDWLASSNDPAKVITCADNATCSIAWPIVWTLIVTLAVLTGFAYTTLLERRILAWLQARVGPNRVGPQGFFQPLADAIKLIFKEDIIPDQVDKPVYYLAPMLKAVPVLILFAVIPFGPPIRLPWFDGNWYDLPLVLADVNVAVLFLIAVISLGTYGMVLAGWSSNNKYSMLGGLRASAQMISYELPMGLVIAVPIMIAGSMSLVEIVELQRYPWQWFVFQNPLAAGILLLALFAEVSRSPFDLTEAEQELTAGYMTEYSGMKFAMFMMAEYIGMIAVSAIAIMLFFGGYHLFPVDNLPIFGPLIFLGKIVAFLTFFIWVRGTLPRIRYDRLMAFGWKVLLPLSLVSVAWTAIAVVLRDTSMTLYTISSGIFFLVVIVGGFFFLSAESGQEFEEAEEDIFQDPVITGQPRSIGWVVLQLVGGLLAIPFAIVNGIIGSIEQFGEAAEGPSDETAIVPSEQGGN
jgi:NADH-quinone oxidoreductase subunit H